MLAGALRELYDYNRRATEHVLDVAAKLTPEQWLAPGNAGRGSIRDTLVHQISAHKGWLAWWDGSLTAEMARRRADVSNFPDVASVRAFWSTVEQSTQAFVDGLTDADVERVYSRPTPDGGIWRPALWQMMLHVANHGTQHRSEVAAMLTQFGHSPGDLDAINFFRPAGDVSTG